MCIIKSGNYYVCVDGMGKQVGHKYRDIKSLDEDMYAGQLRTYSIKDLRFKIEYIQHLINNITGERVGSENFKSISNFSNGLAVVHLENGNWVLINKNGSHIGDEYKWISDLFEGYRLAEIDDKYYVFIDKNGVRVNQKFQDATTFFHGFARVKLKDGKVGYVDFDFNFYTKKQFSFLTALKQNPYKIFELNEKEFNNENYINLAIKNAQKGLNKAIEQAMVLSQLEQIETCISYVENLPARYHEYKQNLSKVETNKIDLTKRTEQLQSIDMQPDETAQV